MQRISYPQPISRFRTPMRGLLTWLACVLLLPLPVPMMHRHDAIEAPQALASHLALRHSDSQEECLDVDEPHWHLVLASHHRDEQQGDDGLPNLSTEYVGSSTASPSSVSWVGERLVDVSSMPRLVWSDWSFDRHSASTDPRPRLAADALLHHRRMTSCVMRC